MSDSTRLSLPIYVVNFNNEIRKQRMTDRFHQLGLEPIFTPPVGGDDSRLIKVPTEYKRVWGNMLQHLDSVHLFLTDPTSPAHCIICEDDIYLDRSLTAKLDTIITQFDQLQLDLLLLGYLLPFKLDMSTCLHQQYFPLLIGGEGPHFHRYPDDLWGAQMYLINRKYGQYLLDTFTMQYAFDHISQNPYCSDWIITKNGHRAMVYPMLAVEEGINTSTHQGQIHFHKVCCEVNYDSQYYI